MNENTLKLSSPAVGAPANPAPAANTRLLEAERYRQARALSEAQAICAELLAEYPDYVGALLTLGLVQAEVDEYEAARVSLSRAAMLNPKDWRIHNALARVYRKLNVREMAIRAWEQAHKLREQDTSILANLAKSYRDEREYELAASTYAKILALDPSLTAARVGLGLSFEKLDRFGEMAEVLGSVLRHNPEDLSALCALSQLPAKYVGIDVLKAIDGLRARRDRSHDEINLAFARAALLDKAGRYEEAWQELVSGNGRLFAGLAERSARNEHANEIFLDMLKRSRPRTQAYPRQAPCRSLFILGPSRSGKSTIERLVGCVPGVRRGYENPSVRTAIHRTFHSADLVASDWLIDLPPEFNRLFCQNYAMQLDERAKGAQVFTNTNASRIIDAARLAMTLPGARFIFVKRDAYDLALRIYGKRYQTGKNLFSYNLAAIFRHIAWYYAMMDEVAGSFPDIVFVVDYEDVVKSPRQSLAQVAELCELRVPDDVELPDIGDDRGAAAPYRGFMDAALSASKP